MVGGLFWYLKMSSQAFSYFGVSVIHFLYSVRDAVSQFFNELEIDSQCGKSLSVFGF